MLSASQLSAINCLKNNYHQLKHGKRCLFTSVCHWKNDAASTTTNTGGGSPYFSGQEFKSSTSESSPPPQPPPSPENFHTKFSRRPLYGYALKGNMVYRESNRFSLKVAFFSAGSFTTLLLLKYYFFQNEENVEKRRLQREKLQNPEYQKLLQSSMDVSDRSDLGRVFKNVFKDELDTKEDHRSRAYLYGNPNDINDAAQVMKREKTGRTFKTMKEIDQELRAK